MVTIVSNIYTWKPLRVDVDFKDSHHKRKKKNNIMWGSIYNYLDIYMYISKHHMHPIKHTIFVNFKNIFEERILTISIIEMRKLRPPQIKYPICDNATTR